jgi:hypothetical protein
VVGGGGMKEMKVNMVDGIWLMESHTYTKYSSEMSCNCFK